MPAAIDCTPVAGSLPFSHEATVRAIVAVSVVLYTAPDSGHVVLIVRENVQLPNDSGLAVSVQAEMVAVPPVKPVMDTVTFRSDPSHAHVRPPTTLFLPNVHALPDVPVPLHCNEPAMFTKYTPLGKPS